MPTTEGGMKRLLNFYVYGMLRGAESLGNPTLVVRKVIEEGLRKFLLSGLPKFETPRDAREAWVAFTKAADESGLVDGSDTIFRGDGDSISVEIGDRCAYRPMCTARHDEGLPVYCIRAIMLTEMLRIRQDADFDWRLNRFGRPCQLTLSRSPWGKS